MSYMYYAGMDSSLSCGEDWHWGRKANSGGWMNVEMYVKLNTPGMPPSAIAPSGPMHYTPTSCPARAELRSRLLSRRPECTWIWLVNYLHLHLHVSA